MAEKSITLENYKYEITVLHFNEQMHQYLVCTEKINLTHLQQYDEPMQDGRPT